MDPLHILKPLIEQALLLAEAVNASPYLSREERLWITKELTDLATQLRGGEVSFPQGEEALTVLHKRTALEEILALMAKLRHLNPRSPRLHVLRALEQELHIGQVSAEQARLKLYALMDNA